MWLKVRTHRRIEVWDVFENAMDALKVSCIKIMNVVDIDIQTHTSMCDCP